MKYDYKTTAASQLFAFIYTRKKCILLLTIKAVFLNNGFMESSILVSILHVYLCPEHGKGANRFTIRFCVHVPYLVFAYKHGCKKLDRILLCESGFMVLLQW